MLPAVVVHGGAGHIPKERAQNSTSGVSAAARAGYIVLKGGGSSMDAVVEAVTQLENNPSFNAGCGSVLNVKGEVEMDAFVMDWKTLATGAVSAVRDIANPTQLARLVIDKKNWRTENKHDAAVLFCVSVVVHSPPDNILLPSRICSLRLYLENKRGGWQEKLRPVCMCTVGAVAVDSEGVVACATSTGGMLNKMEGRVGDTPCIGCGGYADNNSGAVSTTGHGEAIMKVVLARLILFYMEKLSTLNIEHFTQEKNHFEYKQTDSPSLRKKQAFMLCNLSNVRNVINRICKMIHPTPGLPFRVRRWEQSVDGQIEMM
uniref:Isoaspartyl peptidase/L-asparaginase n=1 Tax=Labrus bergylta TaxID=56723 RepID=A0A3Q3EN97_9LABR